MKKFLLFPIFLLITQVAAAQANKLVVGISYLSLDLPDDMAFRPHINYERQFLKRLFINTQAGYVHLNGQNQSFPEIPQTRQRFTLDATLKAGLLRYKNSWLKLGFGPSLWHKNDYITDVLRVIVEPSEFKLTGYTMKTVKQWDLGYHALGEIEIGLSPRLSASGIFSVANLRKSGISSIAGVNVYYKF